MKELSKQEGLSEDETLSLWEEWEDRNDYTDPEGVLNARDVLSSAKAQAENGTATNRHLVIGNPFEEIQS